LSVSEGAEVSRRGLLGEVLSGNNLVDEGSKDTHHSSTSVVELSIPLSDLLGWLLVPVVDVSKPDTVVSVKLGGGPPGELNESAEKDDLKKTGRGNLEKTSNSRVDIGEFKSLGRAEVSIEGPLVVVDEGSEHGHHSNTAVLLLNSTVTREFLLIGDVSKRIKEAKRGNSTNLHVGVNSHEGGLLNLRNNITKQQKTKVKISFAGSLPERLRNGPSLFNYGHMLEFRPSHKRI